MVKFKNLSRFYSRGSGGKVQLDVADIRAGFIAAETASERVRRLRLERVTRIVALETPIPVAEGPKLILHALPVGASDVPWARFLEIMRTEESQTAMALTPIGGQPTTWRFNLDGFVAHTLANDLRRQCYTQLFRDGGLEVVSGRVLVRIDQQGGFYAWGMEATVIGRFAAYQKLWSSLGVPLPMLVTLSLIGIKGWRVLGEVYGSPFGEGSFDRDVAMSPEVIMTDLDTPADLVLRPLFAFVWNGGGWPRSPNYREDRWVPPRT